MSSQIKVLATKFRAHQAKYLDLADNGVVVILVRGEGYKKGPYKYYKLERYEDKAGRKTTDAK